MRVNSVFKGFFDHRLVVAPGIAIMILAIFFIGSSFTKYSDRDLRAKQVNLMIRQIGHRLLLQAGDSTSRVLPVTEVKEGIFLLEFESDFFFDHDSLMMLTWDLLPKTEFPSGYTVTVHHCKTDIIVFGYQINNTTPDILGCKGRSEPRGCYTIEIVFPDLYKTVEQNKADISQMTEQPQSAKVDTESDSPEIDLLQANAKPEELKLSKVDSQKANPTPEEIKTAASDYPLISLVCSGMLVLFSAGLLIGRFGKRLAPVAVQHQDHAIIKEPGQPLASLGKFLFDVKGQRLLLGSEVISLTDKECKVLELLNSNFGELILRETLMQNVWLNEGVITGRSLDMFISKLRKKLSSDPELRITNVHGKGYKLEIPEVQPDLS
jgi:DNA-binding winged helix-turn-helix (wHTH) protein